MFFLGFFFESAGYIEHNVVKKRLRLDVESSTPCNSVACTAVLFVLAVNTKE